MFCGGKAYGHFGKLIPIPDLYRKALDAALEGGPYYGMATKARGRRAYGLAIKARGRGPYGAAFIPGTPTGHYGPIGNSIMFAVNGYYIPVNVRGHRHTLTGIVFR